MICAVCWKIYAVNKKITRPPVAPVATNIISVWKCFSKIFYWGPNDKIACFCTSQLLVYQGETIDINLAVLSRNSSIRKPSNMCSHDMIMITYTCHYSWVTRRLFQKKIFVSQSQNLGQPSSRGDFAWWLNLVEFPLKTFTHKSVLFSTQVFVENV